MTRCVLLLLLATAPVFAQGAAPVTLGDRVRVVAPGAGYPKVTGRVAATTPDAISLVVDRSTTEVAVMRSQIDALYRSVGSRRHTTRGALVGGVLGLFGTLWLGPDAVVAGANGPARPSTTNLAVGAIAGVAIGGLVGFATKTDSWVEVRARP